MFKKILAGLMSLIILLPHLAMASDFDPNKDDIIYGVALTEDEKATVNKSMGAGKDSNISYVDGSDLEKYLGYGTADSNMISSVLVKRSTKDREFLSRLRRQLTLQRLQKVNTPMQQ